MTPRSLAEKRADFSLGIARLLVWAADNLIGYRVAFGEGYVALTDAADGDYDGPHKRGGSHYTGLGIDLTIYDLDWKPVRDGNHHAYRALGAQWKRTDTDARWGGDFESRDGNHFSFLHQGIR